MNLPPLSAQTMALLGAMLGAPTREWYGLELMRASGLKSGTIYPALARLERAGVLASEWEDVDPREQGRPKRRLYRFTPDGYECARTVADLHVRRLGAVPPIRPAFRPRTA